jgi:GNAT superfamily N-acetyltransferase
MDPSTFDIKPVTSSDDDLHAVVAVRATLDRGRESVKDLRALRSTMRQVLHVVAWADGQPIGFGFAGTWPGGEFYPRLDADIGVRPTHRRRGIGSALFRTLSDHARGLGKAGFRFEVFEDRADALAFLLHRGYTEVGRELQFDLPADRGGESGRLPLPPLRDGGAERADAPTARATRLRIAPERHRAAGTARL